MICKKKFIFPNLVKALSKIKLLKSRTTMYCMQTDINFRVAARLNIKYLLRIHFLGVEGIEGGLINP